MSKIVKKPKWGKPKLIVLVRGKLAESILVSCKGQVGGSASPENGWNNCYYTNCSQCNALAWS